MKAAINTPEPPRTAPVYAFGLTIQGKFRPAFVAMWNRTSSTKAFEEWLGGTWAEHKKKGWKRIKTTINIP